MTRPTLWTLALSVTFAALLAGTAEAAPPTPEQKCQASKSNAIRKRDFCRAGENQKALVGKTPDLAKCAATFEKAIVAADKKAAKSSAACRWLEHGDGTATDLNTGLQWELKGQVFYHDYAFTWSRTLISADGSAFGTLLSELNKGRSYDGITTPTGCLGGKCDWRLPSVEELRGILSAQYPNCPSGPGAPPCTSIPGPVRGEDGGSVYWTASTYDNGDLSMAWTVSFEDGSVRFEPKYNLRYVRAVRGQS